VVVGNAIWKGVNFADLPQKSCEWCWDVVVRGADAGSDSFPLEAGLKETSARWFE